MKKFISSILEITGIDVIPYLFGKKFQKDPTHNDDYSESIKKLSETRIEIGLTSSQDILDQEDSRRELFEKKAESLLGMTGLITAFIVGFVNLIINKLLDSTFFSYICVATLFCITLFSLIFSILFAYKVLKVGDYKYKIQSIATYYSNVSLSVKEVYRKRFIENISFYYQNREENNTKGSYVSWAQLWFRNGLVSLFILIIAYLFIFVNYSPQEPYKSEQQVTSTSEMYNTSTQSATLTSIYDNDIQIKTQKPSLQILDTVLPNQTKTSDVTPSPKVIVTP